MDGIDAVAGATAHHEGEASINRLMARQASKVIIVADSSKVGRRAFARICAPAEIDVLVTDTGIAAEDAALLEDAGVDVVTACLDLVVIGDCNPDVLVLGDDVTPAFGQQEKLVDADLAGHRRLGGDHRGGRGPARAPRRARRRGRRRPGRRVHAGPAGRGGRGRRRGRRSATTRPTGMTVALSRGGDRAILTALGAVASLTAADVPAALLAGARHVHVSSYFLLAGLARAGAGRVAFRRPRGRVPPRRWTPTGIRPGGGADEQLSAAIAQADLLLPNEAEAVRAGRGARPGRGGAALAAAGPRVVVKLGERGALCADGPARARVSLPPVMPVDATGAGDCFNAGLIAGLLDGLDLPRAAALGCAAGALSTAAPGGTAAAPGMAAAARLAAGATVT